MLTVQQSINVLKEGVELICKFQRGDRESIRKISDVVITIASDCVKEIRLVFNNIDVEDLMHDAYLRGYEFVKEYEAFYNYNAKVFYKRIESKIRNYMIFMLAGMYQMTVSDMTYYFNLKSGMVRLGEDTVVECLSPGELRKFNYLANIIYNQVVSFDTLDETAITVDEYVIFHESDNKMLNEVLGRLLNTLSPRTTFVLKERFGFEDNCFKTRDEVARKMNVTGERVRQIEMMGIRQLKHRSRSRHLLNSLE